MQPNRLPPSTKPTPQTLVTRTLPASGLGWVLPIALVSVVAACGSDTGTAGDNPDAADEDAGPTAPGSALIDSRSNPSDIVESGGMLYWLETGAVVRAPRAGGTAEPVLDGRGPLTALSVYDGRAFAIENGNTLLEITIESGEVPLEAGALGSATATAAGPGGIFWGELSGSGGTLWRLEDHASVQHHDGAVTAIALGTDAVFWSDGDFVWRAGLDGTDPKRLSSGHVGTAANHGGLVVTDEHVVWLTEPGDVIRITQSGTSEVTIATKALVGGRTTAWYDGHVYVTYRGESQNPSTGAGIGRIPIGGGGLEPLVSLAERPPGLFVDGTLVWTDFQGGTVRTLPLP